MKKVSLIIICLSVLICEKMVGQNNSYIELAETTIENFKCSINKMNYKYYGLSDPDILEKIRVGEAISHYAVKLSALQKYNEGVNPNDIIQEMGYVTVALVNPENKRVESFVLLSRRDGKYYSSGIGNAPFAASYLETIRKMEVRQKTRLIRIPGLNLAFVGIESEEG